MARWQQRRTDPAVACALVRFGPPVADGNSETITAHLLTGNLKRLDAVWHLDPISLGHEAPEGRLMLAEIRATSCAGPRALCLAEAICASRGDEKMLALVRKHLAWAISANSPPFFECTAIRCSLIGSTLVNAGKRLNSSGIEPSQLARYKVRLRSGA